MIDKPETHTIIVPIELIESLSVAKGDTVVMRFEEDRAVYCYLIGDEVIVAEDNYDPEEYEFLDEECEDDLEEDYEIPEVCYGCPHFCHMYGECTRED